MDCGYTYGMTMTRETKTQATSQYAGDLAKVHYAMSPRQLATYGRFIPAPLAARINFSNARITSTRTREMWAASRLTHRARWTNAEGRAVCKGTGRTGHDVARALVQISL